MLKIKTLLLLCSAVCFSGCLPEGMTRAETIAAVKECEAGGMKAKVSFIKFGYAVGDVICVPHKEQSTCKTIPKTSR